MGVAVLGVVALALVAYAAYELLPLSRLHLPARNGDAEARAHMPAGPLDKRLLLILVPAWVVVTLWQTNPLYQNLTTALPNGMDTTQFVWNLWWMKYALVDLHQYPFFTHYQYAPQEINLAFHVFTPLNGILSIPLQVLFGLNAAFNLLLLGGFVASAWGAFLLVRQETGSTPGAVVGSVAFPFAPYVMLHLNGGHFSVVNTWAVPFFALFLLRWLRQGTVRDAALAGLLLACVGYNDLDQVTYCASFGVLAVVYGLGRRLWAAGMARSGGESPADTAVGARRWLAGLAALAGVSVLVYLPQLATYADGARHGWATATPLQASDDFAPDLAGYITPNWLHPVWGQWATGVAAGLHFLDQPKAVFLGYTRLLLALVALLRRGYGNVWRWWAVTVLFWSLSLGPYLHAWGNNRFTSSAGIFSMPLPYQLYHAIPLIGGGRISGYASVMVSLGLSVLAGHGTAVIAARLPRVPGRVLFPLVASFLILFESLTAPLGLFAPQVDPFFAQLAHQPGKAAVLEEPLGWRDGRVVLGNEDTWQLYTATVSQKPIVSGYVGRVADSVFAYYQDQPALAEFIAPDAPPTPASQDPVQVRAALRRMGVGYIVLYHDAFYERLSSYTRDVAGARLIYTDGTLTAYRF